MKTSRYYIIGTAGHVDHGKTALVRALTGMETDRLAEEKKRGLSIELGFAYTTLAGGNVAAFIDVPGHEHFIRTMLAGVCSIDLALFCVAADDGVMPQTREHLDILHLLGLGRAIFVITKIDIATPERIKEVRSEIEALIKGTTLEGAHVVEVSVRADKNINELKEKISSELAMVAALDGTGAVRLPIDRVFSVKGYGAVITGTVVSGTLKVGDELALFTDKGISHARLKVRGIECHNQKVEAVCRGQRAAVNLTGLSHNDIPKGSVLVASAHASAEAAVTKLDCVVDLPPCAEVALKDRCRLKLYHLASERNVTLQLLAGKGGEGRAYGRLHLDRPLQVWRGDRFILRDPSIKRTIGAGTVLMPYPAPSLTPRLKGLDLEGLAKGNLEDVVIAMVRKRGYGLAPCVLSGILNMDGKEFAAFMYSSSGLGVFKDVVLARADIECVQEAVLKAAAAHHSVNSGDIGMRVDVVRAAVKKLIGRGPAFAIADGLFDNGFIEDMVERGLLASIGQGGACVALPLHRAELSDVEVALEAALKTLFEGGVMSVLSADIEALAFEEVDIKKTLAVFLERGEVIKLRNGVYIGSGALNIARERLSAHILERGSIRVAEMRDLLGCGRRLAIEILEYFDKERITLRTGDERVLR